MKEAASDGVIDFGNRIFKWRRFFCLIPLLMLFQTRKNLEYPFGQYVYDEVFELLSFTIVLLGVGIRLWASGSSRRSMLKKDGKIKVRFSTTGIFSIIRNPYFLGESLIIAGLSFLLFDATLILLSLALFFVGYTPILFAREKMLTKTYPALYQVYSKKVPMWIPSFRSWRKNRSRFRWLVALQKEGNLLGAMGILFFCLEQFREFEIQGSWNLNPLWFFLVIPFFVFCLILRAFDPHLKDFPDVPERWDN